MCTKATTFMSTSNVASSASPSVPLYLATKETLDFTLIEYSISNLETLGHSTLKSTAYSTTQGIPN